MVNALHHQQHHQNFKLTSLLISKVHHCLQSIIFVVFVNTNNQEWRINGALAHLYSFLSRQAKLYI